MTLQTHIGPIHVVNYRAFLIDKYPPPSKGGNTRAWHRHSIEVGDNTYSFLALGSKKWIFVNDTVEFDWEWSECKKFRNIVLSSVTTLDKNGKTVVRGERGGKRWRTSALNHLNCPIVISFNF